MTQPNDEAYCAEPSLDRAASQQVRAFFNRAHGEIEQMLNDTTRLLSGLTDSAAALTHARELLDLAGAAS